MPLICSRTLAPGIGMNHAQLMLSAEKTLAD